MVTSPLPHLRLVIRWGPVHLVIRWWPVLSLTFALSSDGGQSSPSPSPSHPMVASPPSHPMVASPLPHLHLVIRWWPVHLVIRWWPVLSLTFAQSSDGGQST